MGPSTRTPMRERLLEAATDLFYLQGLRAVSVDKVIDAAGTTKVTFYRHFKSKDDLIVAYLEGRAALERAGIGAALARGNGDVGATLELMAEQVGLAACMSGFRGCPFINAAAEYPDPASPVRRAVAAHRQWCRAAFEQLVAPLGRKGSDEVVDSLMLLRDGAMVSGYLDEPAAVAGAFLRGVRAVIGTTVAETR
ncbi:TetR/AcrR family transcriptional regulator [Marinitenerispora sediminis]|uniref:TetR family transcriptional regulator n=1 Tax=Marinitenerispora sediminis TaxID=1931232 RepID=A0A368T4H3_9ACTN|nr:TetR/AcrR family transcriptional regulator [Marinitenerispora sediminis]RCV50303.1 TetR family transcriptional regulator [Marinitenerispora sediminis]RCV53762.1 TetR family transcriptional regulator [Marinitenerispora sediminis]RCV58051.1 TetR family transcriptional regulator [Marinitenerispora sediminis]